MSSGDTAEAEVIARYADRTPVPWANGAGSTVELVSLEDSTHLTPGTGRWRLSVATLERPADFSPLSGMHRTFMPVGGDVVLEIDGGRQRIGDGVAHSFDGASRTVLVSLPAPCRAVNLMVEGASGIRMVAGTEATPQSDDALILSLEPTELDGTVHEPLTLLRPRSEHAKRRLLSQRAVMVASPL